MDGSWILDTKQKKMDEQCMKNGLGIVYNKWETIKTANKESNARENQCNTVKNGWEMDEPGVRSKIDETQMKYNGTNEKWMKISSF